MVPNSRGGYLRLEVIGSLPFAIFVKNGGTGKVQFIGKPRGDLWENRTRGSTLGRNYSQIRAIFVPA